MREIILILTVLLFKLFWSPAQNLIPNPNFSVISGCPEFHFQIERAIPWTRATQAFPTLYHRCADLESEWGLPNLRVASHNLYKTNLESRSGDGMAMIWSYSITGPETRCGYLQTPMLHALEKDKWYYIEFYINSIFAPDAPRKLYTDAIGLGFSDTLYYEAIPMRGSVSIPPAIEHHGELIYDLENWKKISGCYKAKGGEEYAIIGNFRDAGETMVEIWPSIYTLVHNGFFIDDVLVMEFDPFPDTLFVCETDEVVLDTRFPGESFHWSTGDTESHLNVSTPGTYSVEVFMENCVLYDTTQIFFMSEASEVSGKDTTLCEGATLYLEATYPGAYNWSDGSQERNFSVTSDGIYAVSITNDCGLYVETTDVVFEPCGCQVFVPTAFTPNGDGINDLFECHIDCNISYVLNSVSIYDRWGNVLFQTHQPESTFWDGTVRGHAVSSGTYIYTVVLEEYHEEGKKVRTFQGEINLLR